MRSLRTHPHCSDCGLSAPLEVGEYTLFSARFGWRLTREVEAGGPLHLTWLCPRCARTRRDGRAPVRVAKPCAPRVLVLDSQDTRRERLAERLGASARLDVQTMAWPELRMLATPPSTCAIHADDPLARVFVNATRAHLPGTWIVGLGPLDGADEILPSPTAERLAWAVLRRSTPRMPPHPSSGS